MCAAAANWFASLWNSIGTCCEGLGPLTPSFDSENQSIPHPGNPRIGHATERPTFSYITAPSLPRVTRVCKRATGSSLNVSTELVGLSVPVTGDAGSLHDSVNFTLAVQ